MKVERKGYVPTVITLETEEEAKAVQQLITHGLIYDKTINRYETTADSFGMKLLSQLRTD